MDFQYKIGEVWVMDINICIIVTMCKSWVVSFIFIVLILCIILCSHLIPNHVSRNNVLSLHAFKNKILNLHFL